jgi:hypothetical protein
MLARKEMIEEELIIDSGSSGSRQLMDFKPLR